MPSEPDASPEVISGRRRRSQRQLQESTKNRQAIVRNALGFFARYGYSKTTLQAVAERVGLTRTGLLHHFQSKEGLFVEAIEEGRRWAESQTRNSATGSVGLDGIRALRGFLGNAEDAVYVQFVHTVQAEALHEDAPEHVRKYVHLRVGQIRANVMRRLEEARSSKEIGDVDIEAMTTMITGTINGLQMQWLLDNSVDTAAALDALVDLLAATAPARRT